MSTTDGLYKVLANTYLLYLKTQNYHWNVTGGAYFKTVHELFETHYLELASAIDIIAERIRQLGAKVPATLVSFAEAAQLKEGQENKACPEMLRELAADQDKMVAMIKEVWNVADQEQDEVTADMLIARMAAHSKAAWFYTSSLN